MDAALDDVSLDVGMAFSQISDLVTRIGATSAFADVTFKALAADLKAELTTQKAAVLAQQERLSRLSQVSRDANPRLFNEAVQQLNQSLAKIGEGERYLVTLADKAGQARAATHHLKGLDEAITNTWGQLDGLKGAAGVIKWVGVGFAIVGVGQEVSAAFSADEFSWQSVGRVGGSLWNLAWAAIEVSTPLGLLDAALSLCDPNWKNNIVGALGLVYDTLSTAESDAGLDIETTLEIATNYITEVQGLNVTQARQNISQMESYSAPSSTTPQTTTESNDLSQRQCGTDRQQQPVDDCNGSYYGNYTNNLCSIDGFTSLDEKNGCITSDGTTLTPKQVDQQQYQGFFESLND